MDGVESGLKPVTVPEFMEVAQPNKIQQVVSKALIPCPADEWSVNLLEDLDVIETGELSYSFAIPEEDIVSVSRNSRSKSPVEIFVVEQEVMEVLED